MAMAWASQYLDGSMSLTHSLEWQNDALVGGKGASQKGGHRLTYQLQA